MSEISPIDERLGARLLYYRKKKGLTQYEVAEKVKISRTAYSQYERGVTYPSFAILRRIIKLFDVDFNTILGYDEDK